MRHGYGYGDDPSQQWTAPGYHQQQPESQQPYMQPQQQWSYQPQQPYMQPQQQWSYQPPGPPSGRPPQNQGRRAAKIILGGIGVIIVLGAVGAALGGHNRNSSDARAAASGGVRSTAPAPAPSATRKTQVPTLKLRTIATFTGSGIQNTPQFTVGGNGTWKLLWAYNCASFGSSGNFIVSTDDMNDPNGVDVNELNTHGHGATYAYDDAGRHFLSVNSECNWRVRVIGTP
jgi:hypothetical protein